MLLTFNRPKALNAVNDELRLTVNAVLTWFEEHPELWCVGFCRRHSGGSDFCYRVVVITGEGSTFCAGADLLEWKRKQERGEAGQTRDSGMENGFAAISRRNSSKPIIAAVNGSAYGGGVEVLLNCDLVIASEQAVFALPEVKRGVVAVQGGSCRVVFESITHRCWVALTCMQAFPDCRGLPVIK